MRQSQQPPARRRLVSTNNILSGQLRAGTDADNDALTYALVDGSVVGGTVSIGSKAR